MKKRYFQNFILLKILVVIGLLLEMMILFEIPIIAVIYIWCQLNKGMKSIGLKNILSKTSEYETSLT